MFGPEGSSMGSQAFLEADMDHYLFKAAIPCLTQRLDPHEL